METLSEKLKSLGVQVGASNIPPPKPKIQKYRVEDVVVGLYVDSVQGKTFIATNQYSDDYVHGDINLHASLISDFLWEWGCVDPTQKDLESCLFIDAETSGLAGGTGTFIFLLGVGYFKDKVFHMRQYFMDNPASELPFLNEIDNILHSFSTLISFNGKSFDIPLLRSRFIMNRFPVSFTNYGHIDLLHISRKLWRNRLVNRSLGDLEREILHFQRSHEEVPGWLVPQIYFDYLHDGDARPLEGVFYHNAMDVVSMAALFKHISYILSDSPAPNLNHSLDIAAVARLYEEMGYIDRAISSYELALEKGLPETFFINTLQRYANIFKKMGSFEKACEVWMKSAAHQDAFSCIELAKYFEHIQKNYHEAISWVDKAIEILAGTLSSQTGQLSDGDLVKRKNRLISRLEYPKLKAES